MLTVERRWIFDKLVLSIGNNSKEKIGAFRGEIEERDRHLRDYADMDGFTQVSVITRYIFENIAPISRVVALFSGKRSSLCY